MRKPNELHGKRSGGKVHHLGFPQVKKYLTKNSGLTPEAMKTILPKELKRPRVLLQSALIFLPIMAVIVWMSIYIYRNDLSRNMKEIRNASEKNMLDKERCLADKIEDTIQDLHFIASLPEVPDALENFHGTAAERLKKTLTSLSNAKTTYDQIRFLDDSGKEVIRINYDPLKKARAVKESQLQEKKHRYYFTAIQTLKGNDVYISPFDLNVEHRNIEQPHKPTLRFARSVFDSRGKKRGFAIINLLGKPLVESLGFHLSTRHNELMLLNDEGFYLAGAPDDNNWGFMFPGTEKAITFATHFPDEWARIIDAENSQFHTKSGLFSFKKIHPLPKSALIDSGIFHWYMVSFIPANKLKAILPVKLDYVTLPLFTGLILFAGTLLLTIRIERSLQSRKNLEKLAAEIQAFYDHTPTLITICSPEGKYLMVNKATAEFFKMPKEKIIGKNLADLLPPELVKVFLKRIEKVTATNVPIMARDHIHINNHEQFFHSVLFPIRFENAPPSMFGVSSIDITNQVRYQNVLKENEARFRSLFEGSPDAIFLADTSSGIITGANEKASILTGFAKEKLIGKHIASLHPEDQQKTVAESFSEHETEPWKFRTSTPIESAVQHKDGHTIPVEIIRHKMKLDKRNVIYSIFRDITTRKKTESELLEKTVMLETVSGSVPAYIFMKDKDLYYTFINRYALKQHNIFPPEQMIGKTDYDIFPKGIANTYRFNDKKVLETKQPIINMEEEMILPDGTIIPVLTNKFPLFNKQGETEGIIGISIDLSEQKKAEEQKRKLEHQLHNSHKLETLGTLSGGIAHDFNNILTPIIGFTEIAIHNLPPESDAVQDLHAVLKAAKQAKRLVQQILTFSRQEPQNLLPQKLQPLIKESLDFLIHSIPTTVKIEKLIEEFDDMIMCDASQIQQIIMNLCTNAWQAMETEPRILTVVLKKTIIEKFMASSHKNLKENQQYAVITVKDTGKGMAKDEIDKMFDPFYTTKEVGKGTGLGLSVVYGIVQGHNGEITVESQKDKGTSISVFLPLMKEWQKSTDNEADFDR
ncbi:PAS domain S-box protein [Prosthecochloris sp.]|uniref:PAS domain S-box protein n=1 Tax=Prosthecochloris sp. TaxID=290513 RepID=UPI00257A349E|nr:PAS domain S-box protein [Prosthecochloris sp.]